MSTRIITEEGFTAKQKEAALSGLRGMAEIVRNEMLVRGVYISHDVVDEELAKRGSVCRGHRACAVGSAYLGYGIVPRRDEDGGYELPGVSQEERDDFTRGRRKGLRLMLLALDEAALRYAKKAHDERAVDAISRRLNPKLPSGGVGDGIEWLFEVAMVDDREALLWIVNAARRIVRAS